ncbi:MAG: amidohydrolase family protein [Armatimonadetes bacterium]|nr:amidohydrolase family protein [Armatimonadota bacterium]
MPGIIDFHTHAFPDALAPRAMGTLMEAGDIEAFLDGTLADLRRSMDRCGIERSVVCSIATKPSQFEAILKWSLAIRSDRITPFASVHPADPLAAERVGRIAAEGLKGIKLHPYYQDFDMDAEAIFPIYEAASAAGLAICMHTGFDIAFPFTDRCGPRRIANVAARFPGLTLVTTHLGAWKQWEEVRERLLGKPIRMEISFSLDYLPPDVAREMILSHPPERILFGTDSPWRSQERTLAQLRALNLGAEREALILRENALRVIGG